MARKGEVQCVTSLPPPIQITYMEKDMDTDIPQILCTKIDEHAGAWPSESFVSLFRTARKCVEPKMHSRPEVHEVSFLSSVIILLQQCTDKNWIDNLVSYVQGRRSLGMGL